MEFNPTVIEQKRVALEQLSSESTDYILERVRRVMPGATSMEIIPCPWFPGGGSLLVRFQVEGKSCFGKIKSKSLTVESKLECESEFSSRGALANEADFCRHLADSPNIPRLMAYEEGGDLAIIVFEELTPFETGIKQLDAWEQYAALGQIETLIRRLFDQGIAHTDVHEKNILFRSKTPILCDFEEARHIKQDLPFEESLDVCGENRYGNVGQFPEGKGIKGLTCLQRLRRVFRDSIKQALPAYLERCHFSDDCPFNLDELQGRDERVYQSVQVDDLILSGQRPAQDHRQTILENLIEALAGSMGTDLHIVDLGSNLGNLSHCAAENSKVARVTGLEAYPEFVKAATLITFLKNQDKIRFEEFRAGENKFPERTIDILLLFSVYHHIPDKTAFLRTLKEQRPRAIIAEMAVQGRYYPERKNLALELRHICQTLGYANCQFIGLTRDYRRPIYLFSDFPDLEPQQIKQILKSREELLSSKKNLIASIRQTLAPWIETIPLLAPPKKKVPLPRRFDRALNWISFHICPVAGIFISSENRTPYPEVTGYYIPTLITWGERDLALACARWLVSIQNPDGSWNAPASDIPYTFDTGQILKGLVALVPSHPEFKDAALRGCDWILRQQTSEGRITTPDTSFWGGKVPEAIHLYALQPLKEAAELFSRPDYTAAVQNALACYKQNPRLTDFNVLSHFHAYILEALVDLEERELAATAMQQIARKQRKDGAVPGRPDKHWTCSTGLFQYAVIWYKLGEIERADRAFDYGAQLQNNSGGFYGSYGRRGDYFPNAEISWAVKYFLDALKLKITAHFNRDFHRFPDSLPEKDGRLALVRDALSRANAHQVLDIGCGKGRFLRHLIRDNRESRFCAVDLSSAMLNAVEADEVREGSLLDIPYPDTTFDFIYCVEALEHAVHIRAALIEMLRVLKPGGRLLIIDKNQDRLGDLVLSPWERWFSKNTLKTEIASLGCKVTIHESFFHDGDKDLFLAWEAVKDS